MSEPIPKAGPRYALYYTPDPASLFSQAGQSWLGRDVWRTAQHLPVPVELITPEVLDPATRKPRSYGFHATLVAPFHLSPEHDERDLLDAVSRFCAARSGFLARLGVTRLGGFVALMETEPSPLSALAAACVRQFHHFAAPLEAYDLNRRLASARTPRQKMNVEHWGYGPVMEDFIFHITLSNRLASQTADQISAAARQWFDPHLAEPVEIAGLALFKQDHRQADFEAVTYTPFNQSVKA